MQVDPATAPKVDIGATLDLRTLTRVSQLVIVTSTPGSIVQVYGTTLRKPPGSLHSKQWTKLTGLHLLHRRRSVLQLRYYRHRQFRQLLIWIVKAPRSSTKQAPGHVSINALTLFEPRSAG